MKPNSIPPLGLPAGLPTGLNDAEWGAILRRIFSHTGLERNLDSKRKSLIEALGELGELENITRASFSPSPALAPPTALLDSVNSSPMPAGSEAVPQPAFRTRANSPAPSAPPTASTAPGYRSARREYQSALGNQGLIEALLRYHRRAGRTGSFSPVGSEGALGFTSVRIPEIQTELKEGPARRAPGIAVPVLRTKKEL